VGDLGDAATRALIEAAHRVYEPNRVMVVSDPSAAGAEAWAEKIPLLRGKQPVDGKPTAYVCRNYTCRRPVTTPAELLRELGRD
jgi:hypothetical protein